MEKLILSFICIAYKKYQNKMIANGLTKQMDKRSNSIESLETSLKHKNTGIQTRVVQEKDSRDRRYPIKAMLLVKRDNY